MENEKDARWNQHGCELQVRIKIRGPTTYDMTDLKTVASAVGGIRPQKQHSELGIGVYGYQREVEGQ